MARNGSGTYIPPASTWNPAVDGTPILSEDWNTLLADLTLALTQSLASNGQTTASARIPFAQGISVANGSVALPGFSFTSDPDTGIFRDGANVLAIAAAGNQIATFEENAVDISGSLTVAATATLNSNVILGDAVGDTITVNGTTNFVGPVTLPNATVTNAKLADMVTATIKGRVTAGTGVPEDLTATQATTILNAVVGATQSVAGTKGLAPAAPAASQNYPLTGGGTYQRGVGRSFGTIINTTTVNGSQPTLSGSLNVASISVVTVSGGLASATLTFTNALPDTTYAVFVQGDGILGVNETSYGSRTTSTVIIYWDATAGNREICVSGF